jgi:hypothetical protein
MNTAVPIIRMATLDNDQQFQFVEVGEGTGIYQIRNSGYDGYLARADAGNVWTMLWVADPNSPNSWPSSTADNKLLNAQWQIVDKDDHIVLKNVAGSGYLGTDAVASPSDTYANKGETAANSKWIIAEATGEVDKSALQSKYDEALALFNNTSSGTGSDQYPVNTRSALQTALETAQSVLENSEAYIEDVNDALDGLISTLAAYKASVYPLQPSTTATYYIQHSSGYYFSNGRTLSSATYAADQHYTFAAAGGDFYNIKNSAGEYLTRSSNGYSLNWETDGTVTTAHFRMKSTGTGYYTIQCAALTSTKVEPYWFMGTDNNTAGEGVYIDKNGTDGKHYWKITDITVVPVSKVALEEAVSKADEFLAYAVRGNGADRYPETEYDALTAAKAAALTVIDNAAATQAEISAATTVLNDALAACIAAVKPLNPDVTKTYNIIAYDNLYMTAIDYVEGDKTNALQVTADNQADNQKIQFLAAPGTEDLYNIAIASVPSGIYITRCTDPHASEAGKYDDYKAIWGNDATSPFAQFKMKRVGIKNYYTIECSAPGPQRTLSCLGTNAGETGIYIEKSGTDTKHYWRIVEFGTGNSIENIDANNVSVYSDNGNLSVANLQGANKISIYSITGQLISVETGVYSQYTKSLSRGIYLVVIEGVTPYRGKAVVR